MPLRSWSHPANQHEELFGFGQANCQDVEGVGNFLRGVEQISQVFLLKHYYENARNQDKKNQKL